MPTYDYVCENCRHRFEVRHGVHEAGPERCPACGKGPVRKGFAPPTIHFKGSGWAKKDRSTASRSASRAAESPTADSGSSSDSGGGDKAAAANDKGQSSGKDGTDGSPSTDAKPATDKKT